MKKTLFYTALISLVVISCKQSSYLHQVQSGPKDHTLLNKYCRESERRVAAFFGHAFRQTFSVVVHPDRAALDSCWQQEWKMPDFHSECWMVASGVATRLDVLSPEVWGKQACEHQWSDSIASQQLIAHEMTHVFHGQHNASPDFSDVQGIDWFVEGLAVYASGQCDTKRMQDVRQYLKERPAPKQLDAFWSGKYKYGLSGSMVMFVDRKIGRKALYKLLVYNKKEPILQAIGMDEPELIDAWKKWMEGLPS